MNTCVCPSYIATGTQVGKLQGGPWTPYALAIADCYQIQVPLFLKVNTGFTGVALERNVVKTQPLQYDALIFGALINGGDSEENVNTIFLQVSDNKSYIFWSVPSTTSASPLIAYGALATSSFTTYPTSILRLPEAFFLPAGTELIHEWSQPTGGSATGGSITWIGVQLINPFQRKAPEVITMPSGEVIGVGSRVPWLMPIGIGIRSYLAGVQGFVWNAGKSHLEYTAPIECGLEIHDLITSTFRLSGLSLDPDNQLFKLAINRNREMWTFNLTPFTASFGDVRQIYPALPLVKPLIFKKLENLQLRFQNNTGDEIDDGLVVIRGVQLCQY